MAFAACRLSGRRRGTGRRRRAGAGLTEFRERFAPMRLLYLCVVYLLAPLVGIAMPLWGFRDHSYWSKFRRAVRLWRNPWYAGSRLWGAGAVSVGEIGLGSSRTRAARERYPSAAGRDHHCHTDGAQRARALFAGLAHVRYVPYDLPGIGRARSSTACHCVSRSSSQTRTVAEPASRMWPARRATGARGRAHLATFDWPLPAPRRALPEALANGIVIAAQSAADAERFRYIGRIRCAPT